MKRQKITDPMVLKTGLKKLRVVHPVNVSFACEHSLYMAVLIQHLNDAMTFNSLLTNNDFIAKDMLNVLYQVYMPLAMLSKEFTHYDLHDSNVLLYEPVKGKYIHYHYHINHPTNGPTVTSFKCKYIAKIIDYGRSFFNDNDNPRFTGSSKGIYTEVCAEPKCPKCGEDQGFAYLQKSTKKDLIENYGICSQIHNESHDLRLLYMIRCRLKQNTKSIIAGPLIMEALEKVVYGKGVKLDAEMKKLLAADPNQWVHFGTLEQNATGLPKKINNVNDAYKELQRLVSVIGFRNANHMYYTLYDKLGDLHIYDDGRPMRYVPA